ncbi:MAG: S8 family serine peptidase [Acidobacteria bacterium]|nr:S8 family serine peptidase [Acidobacteriota bacterium]
MTNVIQPPDQIGMVEKPVQFSQPQLHALLVEITNFLRLNEARSMFSVTGNGFTAAVLDTGLRATHIDFSGRVKAQRNFTSDNGGNPNDASDGQGHGTNVGGIIAANGRHIGVAPGAGIVPLKVLTNMGGGSFNAVAEALDWVLENRQQYNITVVSMSLGDSGNYTSDGGFEDDKVSNRIRQLKAERVPVVVAAGNDFATHNSEPGMSFPAILSDTISVGAVYDSNIGGPISYGQDGNLGTAFSTRAGQLTPFSQRLHESVNPHTRTDIFAPGAPVTSSGIASDNGESVQSGTSQATPVIAGMVLLMQQFYFRQTNQMPAVEDLVTWLRQGGVEIEDGDDENDNVHHTGLKYFRVDALTALDAVRRHLQLRLLVEARALRA